MPLVNRIYAPADVPSLKAQGKSPRKALQTMETLTCTEFISCSGKEGFHRRPERVTKESSPKSSWRNYQGCLNPRLLLEGFQKNFQWNWSPEFHTGTYVHGASHLFTILKIVAGVIVCVQGLPCEFRAWAHNVTKLHLMDLYGTYSCRVIQNELMEGGCDGRSIDTYFWYRYLLIDTLVFRFTWKIVSFPAKNVKFFCKYRQIFFKKW